MAFCTADVRRSSAALMLLCGLACPDGDAKVIHRERSLYSTILVDQRGSVICLQFSVRRDQRNQSCIDRNRPRSMVFGYTKMMMSGLLLTPNPSRILLVGLGGGTLAVALSEIYPHAHIDTVEIDPAVQQVAETYFGFRASERIKVHVQDGRVYTKRAQARGDQYDLIMLDAFNGDYIPEHLMTAEYLEETKAILGPAGVLVANTFAVSRLYDHESVTYASVFGEFFNVKIPDSANRVIIASPQELPSRQELLARAVNLAPKLRPYEIRLGDFPRRFSTTVDWDVDARPLTDQYSPANLLRDQ